MSSPSIVHSDQSVETDRITRFDRMEKLLGWSFIGKEKMTGLPEYRNGASSSPALPLPPRYHPTIYPRRIADE